jgi:GNAT superfamily N-acetyltransferase
MDSKQTAPSELVSSDDRPTVQVSLRDGTVAELGPLAPEDRELLAEGLSQMSEESRFARFGSGRSSLSEAELHYLTDVDQVSHVAWGATIDGSPAGVGRYIVGDEAEAEIAIAVVDRYQGIGLGRALFDALVASARAGAVEAFSFSIQPWNRVVIRMMEGFDVRFDESEGMLTGRLVVEGIPPGDREGEFVAALDRARVGVTPTRPAPGPMPRS